MAIAMRTAVPVDLYCYTDVELWTGAAFLVVGTGVELCVLWTGVGSSVEFGIRVSGGNWWGTSVETRCLWWVVEVGCAVEGRGRFVRGVCGN